MISENIDIVCFSLARWDAPISSPALSLAKEFARTNRVFFIDHPLSYKDYLLQRESLQVKNRSPFNSRRNTYKNPSTLPANLTIVSTPLVIPVNYLPPGALYKSLSRRNNLRLFRTFRRLIKDHRVKNFIFINFFDPYYFAEFPADIRPLATVYHCMDDISQVEYTARHGLRLEEEIISKYDLTLCTSTRLKQLKEHLTRHVYLLPNAADYNLFAKASTTQFDLPKELKDLTSPIVGFVGSLEYRTDFQLLRKAALKHKNKTFVFVGPVTANHQELKSITDLSNVVFTGSKSLEEIPAYLQRFDCLIIPYKINILTNSIYPLKINEYLASGKPVVATSFSADMRSFNPVAYIAEDHEHFVNLIDTAVIEDNNALQLQRMQVASHNTWSARVKTFWTILHQVFK